MPARNSGLCAASLCLALLWSVPASAQVVTGTPGSPGATTTLKGNQLPAPPPPFGGTITHAATSSTPVVGADGRAPQGRAQRAPHHDRRPGLRRLRHLRRRHPDAGDGPHREGRAPVYPVPLHGALLAHPRRAGHRAKPSLDRLRRDRRTLDRFPGLQLDHPQGRGQRRQDPQGERLRDVVVREEPQHARPSSTAAPPARSTSGRPGRGSSTSTGSWAGKPTSGRPTCSGITRRCIPGSASRGTTSSPTWRTTPSATCGS